MSVSRPCFLALAMAVAARGQAPAPADPPTWRAALDQGRDRLSESLLGIRPLAFGDALWAPGEDGRHHLLGGAFELDLAGELHDLFDASAAVVTSREGTRLTAGFLDFHPFGGIIAPRGRLWVEKGFHIQVGRFDVPFGNDWQFFASKDSTSISRPLTTEAVMEGGYNDVGLRILGNDGTLNVNAFILRGFGEGRLAGGRIGLTPFGNPFSLKGAREQKTLELGLSVLYDTDARRQKRESAWAADAEGRTGDYSVRAEYLERTREADPAQDRITRHGWHLTQEYGFPDLAAPTTLFLRCERSVQSPAPPAPGDTRDTRLAAGFSLLVKGILQIKAEWQRYLQATSDTRSAPGYSPSVVLAQVVVVL